MIGPDFAFGRLIDAIRPLPRVFRVPVRRPEDHLVFDLLLDNLALHEGPSPHLARVDPSAPGLLIVELPPQSFAERAFLRASAADGADPQDRPSQPPVVPIAGETVPPLPSARARMAGRSRLVFAMPAGQSALPYTLADVLAAMRAWPMVLDPSAQPDPDWPFLRPRRFKDWMSTTIGSSAWAAAKTALASSLEALGGHGLDRRIARAGDRVAARAAGGVSSDDPAGFGRVMLEAMQGELDDLHRRFPALRDGPANEASIAALSLAAAESLSGALARSDLDLAAFGSLPYIPLLLAPHEPSARVTALELPYRLILSPIDPGRWAHRDAPVVHAGRAELWHTRLTTSSADTGQDGPAKVRAIWSPDYPYSPDEIAAFVDPPKPFRMSLDPLDRQMLVRLMAGYGEKSGRRTYTPRAGLAKRLHLSALGGLLDVEGSWDPQPDGVDLSQWRHLATLGRDHYVRVVYVGFLWPFGHAAALVKVTERTFESLGGDPKRRVAILRQRFFVVVRERVRTYSGASHAYGGRNFPFTRVEILTTVTPDLLDPGKANTRSELKAVGGDTIYGGQVVRRMAFWPVAGGGQDVPFEVAATDLAGRRITFSVPLLFVGKLPNDLRSAPIRRAYNDAGTRDRRRADLGGATVCYAPFAAADQGDPRLPTDRMTFAAGEVGAGLAVTEPHVYPETAEATVGIPPLQKLLGRPNAVVDVAYPQVYKDHGFGESAPGENAGQLFLQLVNQVHRLEFGGGQNQAKSDALGALAAPQMVIQGLSKVMGPVAARPPADPTDPGQIAAALANVVANKFDPADFFDGATILGGIPLKDILKLVLDLKGQDVPKLLSRELPDRVESSFGWKTEIEDPDPLNLLVPRADPDNPTNFEMSGTISTPLANPAGATYQALASMDNFKVNLFGFIIIWFESLKFDAKNGRKPDVTVDLRKGDEAVMFGGPLEFVNELRQFIPSNGFSDPPALSVTPSGISASYSLNLPAITVGVFSLTNASLGAGFNLPFDAKPASVRFNFSEREHPFCLTVSLLGGGGFFLIGVSSRGVQEIEAALEFGAMLAIDLGVASGSVEIKAGVYFHWLEPQPDKGSVDLAGYVRLHGELSVLGLISASLTFNLQLGFHKGDGKALVWGEATLVVEVEVLFFSASVSVSCRKEFAGGNSDPKFLDLIPDQATWDEYCGAFAAEAA